MALNIAATNGVIVVVSSLAVRHLGGDRKDRLAAILYQCENTGGALYCRLSIASRYTTGRIHVSLSNDDASRSLNRLLVLVVGLLRLDDNFNLASTLRVAWCYQTQDRDQGRGP